MTVKAFVPQLEKKVNHKRVQRQRKKPSLPLATFFSHCTAERDLMPQNALEEIRARIRPQRKEKRSLLVSRSSSRLLLFLLDR